MDASRDTYFEWLQRRIESLASGESDSEMRECIRSAPDLFSLLLAILREPDLPQKVQQTGANILSYFLLPTDLIPEAFLGVRGLRDDIFLVGLYLQRLMEQGYQQKLESLWIGDVPLKEAVNSILSCRTKLVPADVASSLQMALESAF